MTDFSNSVIMPREDFIELSTAAFDNHHTPPLSERAASTAQTTFIFAAMAAAVTAGSWGWAKAVDWREKQAHERKMDELKVKDNLKK